MSPRRCHLTVTAGHAMPRLRAGMGIVMNRSMRLAAALTMLLGAAGCSPPDADRRDDDGSGSRPSLVPVLAARAQPPISA